MRWSGGLRRRGRPKVESQQNLVGLRKITDHPPEGRRQKPDERRGGEDFLLLGELRVFQYINDLDFIAPLEIVVAKSPQVRDCARERILSGNKPAWHLGVEPNPCGFSRSIHAVRH